MLEGRPFLLRADPWKSNQNHRCDDGSHQGACHRDGRAADDFKGRNAGTARNGDDDAGNRGNRAAQRRCKLHRQDEKNRRNAEFAGKVRNERRKGKEGRIAAAHYDGNDRDEERHDDHDEGAREAEPLRDVDEVGDGARGHQALREDFTGNDERHDSGKLFAHGVEEFDRFVEDFFRGMPEAFQDDGERKRQEHGGRDVKLDAGDDEFAEDKKKNQRDHREHHIESGGSLKVDVFMGIAAVDLPGFFAVFFVKPPLREVVQHRDRCRYDE